MAQGGHATYRLSKHDHGKPRAATRVGKAPSLHSLEAANIVVGIVSLLSIVTLRQDFAGAAGADATSLLTIGNSLVAVHDWTFLLGPGYLAGIGNGMLLGNLMYKSGLVPRRMAVLGLIGGPLAVASATAKLLGIYEQVSVWAAISVFPESLWELSLGIWLIVKGFNPSVIASEKFRLRSDDHGPKIEGVAPVPAP